MKHFKKTLQLLIERTGERLDAAGCPAWFHPVRVAARLPDNAGSEARLVALLHAVLDDGLCLDEDLDELCGSAAVAAAVRFLSRNEERLPFLERVRRIATQGTPEAVTVYYADLLDRTTADYIEKLPPARQSVRERNLGAVSVVESEVQYRSRQAGRSATFMAMMATMGGIQQGIQGRVVLERIKSWLTADQWKLYRECYDISRLPRK